MRTIREINESVIAGGRKTIAVAAADDIPVLEAVRDAVELGLAAAVLVGDGEKIEAALKELGVQSDQIRVIHEPDRKAAAARAVALVREGRAQVLMKGLIGTADFMRAVLNKERGLRTGRELSHMAVIEVPQFNRLILMTDPAMHMYPTLEEKVKILEAAGEVCRALEIENPKAAAVCAVEVVNPAMPPTMDAAVLAQMSARGQIRGVTVDGPLALDVAVSPEAAAHKGLRGPVAGHADILLMPGIEAGNVMWKTLVYMAKAQIAGTIVGAAAPIVLTSRSDSPETKRNSIALALLLGQNGGGE